MKIAKGASYGSLLRKARKDAGKNLVEVAEEVGVAVSLLSDVERGERPPLTPERTIAACRFLETPSAPLLAAALRAGGSISLPATTSKASEAVASLMRGWDGYDDAFFDKLKELAEKGTKK